MRPALRSATRSETRRCFEKNRRAVGDDVRLLAAEIGEVEGIARLLAPGMRIGEVEPVVRPAIRRRTFGDEVVPFEVGKAGECRSHLVNLRPVYVNVARDEKAIKLEIHRERIAAYHGAVAKARADVAVGRQNIAVAIKVDHVCVQLDTTRRFIVSGGGCGNVGGQQRRNRNHEAQKKKSH
jgi:hypothetical protein